MTESELTEQEIYENEVDQLTELYRDDVIQLRQKLAELRTRYSRVGW